MKILLVQGANMSYLGKRQPEIYGTTTAAELDTMLHKQAKDWPAPGFEDTKLGVLMEPEVRHGTSEVHAGVQA
jgi:hypothetical protein